MIKKLTVFIGIFSLLLQLQTPSFAKPKPKPKPAPVESIYEKAKRELPPDVYVMYRIIDRLARANRLDQNPWRVAVIQKYEVNAFASELNYIALYTGILDQVAGDADAIACIVAHEMAHHTQRHQAIGPVEEAKLKEQIVKEAEQEVNREIEDAKADSNSAAVGAVFSQMLFGSDFGLANQGQQRLLDSKVRIEEIVKEKTDKLNQQIAESTRKFEFEADEFGYKYMATAGFDPQGCLRLMNVLGKTATGELDTTHPAIPKRITRLKELISENPPEALKEKGELFLNPPRPLTYELSKDGESLRINSSFGGNAGDAIDQRFRN